MPLFDPDAIVANSDLVGEGKLFGTQPSLDNAVARHGFPLGRMVAGMRKRTGAEINDWWDSRPTERKDQSPAIEARRRNRKARAAQPTAA